MKPSERIKQLMKKLATQCGDSPFDHKIGAIWEYLDEEYEKEKNKCKLCSESWCDGSRHFQVIGGTSNV